MKISVRFDGGKNLFFFDAIRRKGNTEQYDGVCTNCPFGCNMLADMYGVSCAG